MIPRLAPIYERCCRERLAEMFAKRSMIIVQLEAGIFLFFLVLQQPFNGKERWINNYLDI